MARRQRPQRSTDRKDEGNEIHGEAQSRSLIERTIPRGGSGTVARRQRPQRSTDRKDEGNESTAKRSFIRMNYSERRIRDGGKAPTSAAVYRPQGRRQRVHGEAQSRSLIERTIPRGGSGTVARRQRPQRSTDRKDVGNEVHRPRAASRNFKGGSSIGRVLVSKTSCCRFESCPPCHFFLELKVR